MAGLPNLKDINKLMTGVSFEQDLSDGDDDALEEELAAILAGKDPPLRRSSKSDVRAGRPQRTRPTRATSSRGPSERISTGFSFDNDDGDDDNGSDFDENDPTLNAELSKILGLPTHQENVQPEATKLPSRPQNPPPVPARTIIEPSPVPPRVEPSFKQLEPTVVPIDPARDILPTERPKIGVKVLPSVHPHQYRPKTPEADYNQSSGIPCPSVITTPPSDRDKIINLMSDHKKAALLCKKQGDISGALEKMKSVKQLQVLLGQLDNGELVDMNSLPSLLESHSSNSTSIEPEHSTTPSTSDASMSKFDLNMSKESSEPVGNLLEELEKRLAKWREVAQEATAAGNDSKAKRIGRVCKNYEGAIKAYKTGKPYEYDTLAIPAGFSDLPSNSHPTAKPPSDGPPAPKKTANQPEPVVPKGPARIAPQPPHPSQPAQPLPARRATSIKTKEIAYLSERQRLFKEAALNSKRNGDIKQATEYLRMAKGFDPLLEACRKGLPIDTSNIPTPPQLSEEFVVVAHEEMTPHSSEEDEETYRKLEIDLQKQIEMCKRNKDHFLALGDVLSSSKFEKCAVDTLKDLDMLRNFWKKKDPVPRFRYETRLLSIVVCNTELSNNELLVEVVKCIELPCKNNIDSYVKVELPFPSDAHQTARTKIVRDTLNPVYDESLRFNIDRKSRSLVRIFKRHSLKCEVFSKGGLFRSDTLIGTVQVKLIDFESKVTIHNSFPLMDGRRNIGGQMEIKVKLREPLVGKQVEENDYKWLSIL
ncbi:lethal (2) giant discs 1 [Brevipalpus obovatus]|uniref:lethal (2) giant discs 1 n=1 Tax=Brevipalpus obovatus TaxID=246614 RepID=UPI003D9E3AB8